MSQLRVYTSDQTPEDLLNLRIRPQVRFWQQFVSEEINTERVPCERLDRELGEALYALLAEVRDFLTLLDREYAAEAEKMRAGREAANGPQAV